MSDSTSLGDRMKKYEKVTQYVLPQKTPVVIRLDGKAFHTYTKDLDKPFDQDLASAREQTLKSLCENIQGVILGYSQSDEISLVLKDWETYQQQGWFDHKLQKLVSVSASMCTALFNQEVSAIDSLRVEGSDKFADKTAIFDSRAFSLPKEEVINYLIWRQQDWERNSVQLCARSVMSHKECHKKSCKDLITILEDTYGLVWGNLPTKQKRGEFWMKGQGLFEDTPLFKDYRCWIDRVIKEENNE